MKIYHKDVYLPDTFKWDNRPIYLFYTDHANYRRSVNKYNEKIALIDKLKVYKKDIIEVYMQGKHVDRLLIRKGYDKTRDIAFVIRKLKDNKFIVITVWLNFKSDKHKSLDMNKYEKDTI